MKTFVIILLFVAIGCCADEMSDITHKIFEKKDKNGNVNFRMETICRGKTKVMSEMFRPNLQGALVLRTRSYYADGVLVMTESDDHKSGNLDTIAVFHSGADDMEIFTHQTDGSVKPVSTQTLQAYKKQMAAVSDFFNTMQTDTNTTDAEISKRIQETQKEIQDAEKQKTDGKH